MMGWKKKVAIAVISTFLYLGTGHQFATYNWNFYHNQEYKDFRTNNVFGRITFDTLWPLNNRIKPKEIKGNGPVEKINKNAYVVTVTFLWGPKLILNAFLMFIEMIMNVLAAISVVVYSFINFLLSPFGIRI